MEQKQPLDIVAEFISQAIMRLEAAARDNQPIGPETVLISFREGTKLVTLSLGDARNFVLDAGALSELSYANGTIESLNGKVLDALGQAQQCIDSLQDALDSTTRPTEYGWRTAHQPPTEAGTYLCRCRAAAISMDGNLASDNEEWLGLIEVTFIDCGKGQEMVVYGDRGETWDDVVEYAKVPVLAYRAGADISLSRLGFTE